MKFDFWKKSQRALVTTYSGQLALKVSLILAIVYSTVAAQIPTNLVARWVEKTSGSSTSCPELEWNAPTGSTFTVQRLYPGQTAWATVPGAQVDTNDETLWRLKDSGIPGTIARCYAYRVFIGSTTNNTSAEVYLIGNPSLGWNSGEKDSDADGISDSVEMGLVSATNNPHNYQDWADGSGDADGDGVPNAWEAWIDGSGDAVHDPTRMRNPNVVSKPHAIVDQDPEISEEATVQEYEGVPRFTSISAAISALPSAPSSHKYRIIRVCPGIYNENITVNGSYHVAILPARGNSTGMLDGYEGGIHKSYNPRKRWEIRGTHASNPVVTVSSSSLVLDSFVLSRAPSSTGPVVRVSLTGQHQERVYLNRFVNCIMTGNNTGSSPVFEQYRLKTVLSHCTFFMNAANGSSPASAYGMAPATTSNDTSGTTGVQFHNCILWNPVNVSVPEVQDFGSISYINTIMNYRDNQLEGGNPPTGPNPIESVVKVPMFTNPMLTPKGYLVGLTPATAPAEPEGEFLEGEAQGAMALGAPNLHAIRDMHGELRRPAPPDLGAHQWDDDDLDGIPNFADRLMLEDVAEGTNSERMAQARSNITNDDDYDGLNELTEYRFSTDMKNADTYFLSVHQAVRMFLPSDVSIYTKEETQALFYTKTQVDNDFLSKTEAHQTYRPRSEVIRVLPGGDIGMGEFTQGIVP